MKIDQKDFNKARKTFYQNSLSNEQKNIILNSIYEQVPPEDFTETTTFSPYFIFKRKKNFLLTLCMIVFILSGITVASAKSLPGDLLFGIKVGILEPFVLATKTDDNSRIEYKISLLERRINELVELTNNGTKSQRSVGESVRIAERNIRFLEKTPIVDDEKEIFSITEKIETYNNMVGPQLRIQTRLKRDISNEAVHEDEIIVPNI